MSVGMTKTLVDRIGRKFPQYELPAALHFVCGAILAYDAAEGTNPLGDPPDVERVFAAIRLLEDRRNLEVSPFIAAWHPAVDAWDTGKPRGRVAFFDQNLQKALLGESSRSPEQLIGELIDARAGAPTDAQTYSRLADAMLAQLREAVATTEKNFGYLRPLVSQARNRPLTIATLNYDLSIEQAAELEGVAVDTAIEHWINTGRWAWHENGLRLLKLHGSINWFFKEQRRPGHLPRNVVAVAEQTAGARPALLFGQREKLSARGPFLGLLGELERELAGARQLIVIGYSFRDDHVNEVIRRWSTEDMERRLLVVDPNWPERASMNKHFGQPADFRRELQLYLAGDPGRGLPARLSIRRETCSAAVSRLRDEPEDALERELALAPHDRPKIVAVTDLRRLGSTQVEITLGITPLPDGWDFALGQTLNDLQASGRVPTGLHAFSTDGKLHLRVSDALSAEDIHGAVRTLLDATQASHEARLEAEKERLNHCRQRAVEFREELEEHDPEHRILDVTAHRERNVGSIIFNVRIELPDDVESFDVGATIMAALAAQGRGGQQVQASDHGIAFADGTIAPQELLPLVDAALTEVKARYQAAQCADIESADRLSDLAERLRQAFNVDSV
jgi:hypothetical protein